MRAMQGKRMMIRSKKGGDTKEEKKRAPKRRKGKE